MIEPTSQGEETVFRLALHWQILIGMLVGAGVGLALNIAVSDTKTEVPATQLPAEIRSLSIHDTTNRIDIHITDDQGESRVWVVDGTRRIPGSVATLQKLEEKDAQAYALFQTFGRS